MKTNDIFDFKRFGNYVLTDGKSCISRFGLDILTMSLVGLGLYLFICIMHLFGWMQYYHYNHFISIGLMAILFIAIVLAVGSKCYGYVTDKQAGSLYTLVPASTLEKTLSILIWSFLIPVCFLAIYLGIDWLISLVDSNYGSGILQMTGNIRDELSLLVDEAAMEGFNVSFMLNPLTYVDDVMNGILIFVLGALCFKKNKIAMTILSIIAISMVTSSLAFPFLLGGFDPEAWLETLPLFYEHLVVWDTVMDLLGMLGLTVAIYFRLKSIKY